MAGFFCSNEHMIYRHNVLPLVVAILFLMVLYFITGTHKNVSMPWGGFQTAHDAQIQRVLGTSTQKEQSYIDIYKWTVSKK